LISYVATGKLDVLNIPIKPFEESGSFDMDILDEEDDFESLQEAVESGGH